jgi:hypothetical protein
MPQPRPGSAPIAEGRPGGIGSDYVAGMRSCATTPIVSVNALTDSTASVATCQPGATLTIGTIDEPQPADHPLTTDWMLWVKGNLLKKPH